MLQKGDKAAAEFYQQLSAVLNQVEPLMLGPESDGVAKKLITDFTGGGKFSAMSLDCQNEGCNSVKGFVL